MPFLRQLSLRGNNIEVVQPLSFNHLVNMHMLDMSHNRLEDLQASAISSSAHITVLLQGEAPFNNRVTVLFRAENPLVCTQQGYHIVQGGRPIHLVTEKDAICASNYDPSVPASCPNKAMPPPTLFCCNDAPATTTKAPTTTTAATAAPATRATPPRIPVRVTPRTGTQTPSTLIPRISFSPRATAVSPRTTPARPVDLSRFWRLTRPPTLEVVARAQSVPVQPVPAATPTPTPSTSRRTFSMPTRTVDVADVPGSPSLVADEPQLATIADTAATVNAAAFTMPPRNVPVPNVPGVPSLVPGSAAAVGGFAAGSGLAIGESPTDTLPPWLRPTGSGDDVIIEFSDDAANEQLTITG